MAHGLSINHPIGCRGRLLHAHGRQVQELVHDLGGERLDRVPLGLVEAATASLLNKLLHLPTVRMKEAAATADGVLYADAVRHLFDLGEDER